MTDKDKHIKKSVKDGFDSFQRKAPEGIWNSVSAGAKLNDDDYAIKQSFDEANRIAPVNSWQKVKKQVIIDEVWDRISLQNKRRRRAIWIWSIGIIAVFFGSASLYFISDIDSTVQENSGLSQQLVEQSDNLKVDPVDTLINAVDNGLNINEDSENNMLLLNDDTISNNVNSETEFSTSAVIYDQNPSINDDESQDVHNDVNDQSNLPIVQIDSDESGTENYINKMELQKIDTIATNQFLLPELTIIEKPKEEKYRKIEIGFIAGLSNTWILTNDVKDGFSTTSLYTNRFSLGYNYGVNAHYNFSSRSGLAFQYDIRSVYNQGYDFYFKGRLSNRHIELKQQKLALSYKYNFEKYGSSMSYFTFKGGAYLSHSTKETNSIDWIENSNDSDFNTIDYGLKLSFGREHMINRLNVEYGIASDIGIYNITAGSINVPKKFNYTNTFYSGVYMSIRYLF